MNSLDYLVYPKDNYVKQFFEDALYVNPLGGKPFQLSTLHSIPRKQWTVDTRPFHLKDIIQLIALVVLFPLTCIALLCRECNRSLNIKKGNLEDSVVLRSPFKNYCFSLKLNLNGEIDPFTQMQNHLLTQFPDTTRDNLRLIISGSRITNQASLETAMAEQKITSLAQLNSVHFIIAEPTPT